jgi:uncharacterized repeat protein (TIGR03803 family)
LNIFDNTLYGATSIGGTNNYGVLFKYTLPTQASNISFSSVVPTQADISWTNGNGEKRVVFVKVGGTGFWDEPVVPLDNPVYIANNDFKGLDTTGYFCVYNGTGNAVTLFNLYPGTQYMVRVFEYTGTHYLTTTAEGNPNAFITPAEQASTLKGYSSEDNKDALVEIKAQQDAAFGVTLNPSPNNGTFNINVTGKSGLYRVRIMSTLGQLVYDQETVPGLLNVNLNNAVKGMYLISVSPAKADAQNKVFKGAFVIN